MTTLLLWLRVLFVLVGRAAETSSEKWKGKAAAAEQVIGGEPIIGAVVFEVVMALLLIPVYLRAAMVVLATAAPRGVVAKSRRLTLRAMVLGIAPAQLTVAVGCPDCG